MHIFLPNYHEIQIKNGGFFWGGGGVVGAKRK